MSVLSVVVWGENVHEHRNPAVSRIYPRGMHQTLAEGLKELLPSATVSTATLQEPEHGLTAERLAKTDVLTWWGHLAHADVSDVVVDRIQQRVLEGMGLIVLHSGHCSKIFRRLMGTACMLTWREAAERERLWVCNPGHPLWLDWEPVLNCRRRRCTVNPLAYRRLRSRFSSRGLKAAKFSAVAARGGAATVRSSISDPVMKRIQPITTRMSAG
jgi:hypothetical protein